MATTYTQRELYGGAIVVNLPQGFIDSSTLREIPDHQELFLSPSTLTSIIFEINAYQTPSDIDLPVDLPSPQNTEITAPDALASTHHIFDPVGPPDTVDPSSLTPPTKVTLTPSSMTKYPAYAQSCTILSPEIDRRATNITALPLDWQQSPPTQTFETKVYQLLVRMQDHDTDVCVRVNVPLIEFVGHNAVKKDSELKLAEEIIEKVVTSLNVVDFGLFGGAEP